MEVNLVYQASLDGYTADNMWSKVENKGNCLILVKTKEGVRFGGYRSVPFKKDNNYQPDLEAFLFSLDHHLKASLKKGNTERYAIYDHQTRHVTYGGGHDLGIFTPCNSNQSNYSNLGHTFAPPPEFTGTKNCFLAGKYKFFVEEMEIFSLSY